MNSASGFISSATDDTTSSWINTSKLIGELLPIALIERIVCGSPSSPIVKSTGRNSDSGGTRPLTRIVTGIVTGRADTPVDPVDWAKVPLTAANGRTIEKVVAIQALVILPFFTRFIGSP